MAAESDTKAVTTITRIFDVPRELLWKAWTDPGLFMRWWGPKNFTSPVSRMDLRVGGSYLNCMRSPEGQEYWSTGVYREIVPAERMVLTDSFSDEKGNVVPASHYGMAGEWPLELLVTVTFEETGGKTKMILRHEGVPAGIMREQTEAGWNESFDKLIDVLKIQNELVITAEPGKQELILTRVVNAPRDSVFRAQTDPALIPQWWGPRRFTTAVDKMDPRPGGIWRFVQRDADGNAYAFKGVYHEVSAPERIVYTFEFEGAPGHVSLESVTFEELGNSTKMTDKVVYQSVEDRDEMLRSGMEEGARETMDRFAELVAKPGIGKKAA
jgi:uncharacterized protein YndB with AHSA1/START domain